MKRYLRFSLATLLTLTALVAAYLGGYRSGHKAGYDSGYSAAREKFGKPAYFVVPGAQPLPSAAAPISNP